MQKSIIAIIAIAVAAIGYSAYQAMPKEQGLGTGIVTIQGSDTLKDSRTTINNNFSALNATKLQNSDFTGSTGITYAATGTISFDCSEVEGTGIDCSGENITLDATGDWTGTLDGLEGAALLTEAEATAAYQPLESTLTDIADGSIAENLVNTVNPWADNEVVDTITASNYLDLASYFATTTLPAKNATTTATKGIDLSGGCFAINGACISGGSGSGVTDHGALTGLTDNDHPQYFLTSEYFATNTKANLIITKSQVSDFGTYQAPGSYVTSAFATSTYQPLESTLTDIADGTIVENLVNTTNPWADNEVADTITASDYLALATWFATTTKANLTVGVANDLSCTDCINATEIEDIYVLTAGDTMTGNLVVPEVQSNYLLLGSTTKKEITTSERALFMDETGANSDWSFNVANNGYGTISFGSSNGTLNVPTAKTTGPLGNLGNLLFYGYDGNSWEKGAEIKGYITENVTDESIRGGIQLITISGTTSYTPLTAVANKITMIYASSTGLTATSIWGTLYGSASAVGTDAIAEIADIAAALKDGSGDCASGLICLGDHTHSSYLTSLTGALLSTASQNYYFTLTVKGLVATSTLTIPNGTTIVADDPGEITHDTTDNQLVVDDYVIPTKQYMRVTIASSTWTKMSSAVPLPLLDDAYTVINFHCYVTGGTSEQVIMTDGTNAMDTITCDADNATDDGTIANNTVTALERMKLTKGTTSGAVDSVTFTIVYRVTRE